MMGYGFIGESRAAFFIAYGYYVYAWEPSPTIVKGLRLGCFIQLARFRPGSTLLNG
jgi:hypothetical protein